VSKKVFFERCLYICPYFSLSDFIVCHHPEVLCSERLLTLALVEYICCRDGNLSESEVEMDGEHNEVTLPQDLPGHGNNKSAKSAIRYAAHFYIFLVRVASSVFTAHLQ